jgi:hypothetical protein
MTDPVAAPVRPLLVSHGWDDICECSFDQRAGVAVEPVVDRSDGVPEVHAGGPARRRPEPDDPAGADGRGGTVNTGRAVIVTDAREARLPSLLR